MPITTALHRTLLAGAISLSAGCAYNATGIPPRATLIFEYSIEGSQLYKGNNLAYYLVVNARPVEGQGAEGNEQQAPLVNGPAPLTYPYPDPRSYLPWVRDQRDFLDIQPINVPQTYWTDYFSLHEEAGQFVMWQGRRNDDGSVNERYRQLQEGREWGIINNKTIQITVPFDQLNFENPSTPPAEVPANLAVALRNLDAPRPGVIYERPHAVLDRWGQTWNFFFTIQTRQINQNLYDTVGTIAFPQNLPPGVDAASVNLTTITYRVVKEAQ